MLVVYSFSLDHEEEDTPCNLERLKLIACAA